MRWRIEVRPERELQDEHNKTLHALRAEEWARALHAFAIEGAQRASPSEGAASTVTTHDVPTRHKDGVHVLSTANGAGEGGALGNLIAKFLHFHTLCKAASNHPTHTTVDTAVARNVEEARWCVKSKSGVRAPETVSVTPPVMAKRQSCMQH